MNIQLLTRGYPSPTRRQRVLVVEPDHVTAESYRAGLRIAGFDVDCTRDGEDALGRIMALGVPDVILPDLGLPRIDPARRRRDSFDLLDVLRASRLTDTLPVLAMSEDHGSLIEALHRGLAAACHLGCGHHRLFASSRKCSTTELQAIGSGRETCLPN